MAVSGLSPSPLPSPSPPSTSPSSSSLSLASATAHVSPDPDKDHRNSNPDRRNPAPALPRSRQHLQPSPDARANNTTSSKPRTHVAVSPGAALRSAALAFHGPSPTLSTSTATSASLTHSNASSPKPTDAGALAAATKVGSPLNRLHAPSAHSSAHSLTYASANSPRRAMTDANDSSADLSDSHRGALAAGRRPPSAPPSQSSAQSSLLAATRAAAAHRNPRPASHIAASQSNETASNPAAAGHLRNSIQRPPTRSPTRLHTITSSNPDEEGPDESSIPATDRLVALFEAKKPEPKPNPKLKPSVPKTAKPATPSRTKSKGMKPLDSPSAAARTPPILSPKPIRPSLNLRLESQSLKESDDGSKDTDSGLQTDQEKGAFAKVVTANKAPSLEPEVNSGANTTNSSKKAPTPPPARRTVKKQNHHYRQSSPDSQIRPAARGKPVVSSNAQTRPNDPNISKGASTDNTSLPRQSLPVPPKPAASLSQHAQDTKTSKAAPPLPSRNTTVSRSSMRPLPAPIRPQITADSLADAMVASSLSLASARAISPPKTAGLPPLHRKTHSFSFLRPTSPRVASPTRTPSPMKQMRRTLRPTTSDEKLDKHSRAFRARSTERTGPALGSYDPRDESSQSHRSHGHLLKKHPHKHSEGTRRRWREALTERERKRYEGVWAANRSLLITESKARVTGGSGNGAGAHKDSIGIQMCDVDAGATLQDVHGLVVRDIWQRSGLEGRLLGEVWDLVEGGGRTVRVREASILGNAQDARFVVSGLRDSIEDPLQRRRGYLRRDEFVVGLWLIDQGLKGRKLPLNVSDSVWSSVRGLTRGITTR